MTPIARKRTTSSAPTSSAPIASLLLSIASLSPEPVARVVERTAFDAMTDEMTRNRQTSHVRPEAFFFLPLLLIARGTDDGQSHLMEAESARIDLDTARTWGHSVLVA